MEVILGGLAATVFTLYKSYSWLLALPDLSILFQSLRFFEDGWGDIDLISKLLREKYNSNAQPEPIFVKWQTDWKKNDNKLAISRIGSFISPQHAILPEESKTAYFQIILPSSFEQFTNETGFTQGTKNLKIVVMGAALGDHGFKWRRSKFSYPLAKEGIGSILLQIPFYGKRMPKNAKPTTINKVSDTGALTLGVVDETIAIFDFLRKEGFVGPFGVSGVSMGGGPTIIIASKVDFPIAVCSLISGHTPAIPFTKGIISKVVAWDALVDNKHASNTEEAKKKLFDFLDVMNVQRTSFPKNPFSLVVVGAKSDFYMPYETTKAVSEHFGKDKENGTVEMKWINGGHIAAYMTSNAYFAESIVKSFELLEKKLSPKAKL